MSEQTDDLIWGLYHHEAALKNLAGIIFLMTEASTVKPYIDKHIFSNHFFALVRNTSAITEL
jgi:hypothetical protein